MTRLLRICLVLFVTLLLMFAVHGHATTVTGTLKVNGTPFNGYAVVTLNYPASSGSYINLPSPSGPIAVVNGVLGGPSTSGILLDGNDILLPSKTYYKFDLYDSFGNEVSTLNYYISGTTFDIGSAVPTPILTNNVSFLDLLGLRSISVQNLTILNSLIFGNTVINSSGISGAQSVNDILFSAAYNLANPSSTTCGVQEAENALPSTGGIIFLQRGACTVTTTITITKPTVVMGFGGGGFADNSTFTTYSSGTLLNASTGNNQLFSIGPPISGTLSGVTLQGFAVNGSGAFNSIIRVGQNSATSFVNSVTLRDVFTYATPTCSIEINGNVNGILLDHSSFVKGTGSGVCMLGSAPTYSITGVHILNSQLARNSLDGLHVDSSATRGITIQESNLDNNGGNGVDILSGSSSVVLKSSSSTFRYNSRGIQISDGSGSSVQDDFAGNSVQTYGLYIDVPSSTNVNYTVKDETWGGNTTADIFTGGLTHQVVSYPSKTAPTTSQTVAGTVVSPILGTQTALTSGTNGYYRQDTDGTYEEYVSTPTLGTNTTTTVTLPHSIATTFVLCTCSDNSSRVQTGNTQAVGCNISGQSAPYSTVQILTQASSVTAYCHVVGK